MESVHLRNESCTTYGTPTRTVANPRRRRCSFILFGGLGVAMLLWCQEARAQAVVTEQAAAKEIGRKSGWIIREETPTGVIELQSIVYGMPKYYITTNAVAADSISTDECLPGGSSGLGLTGSGVTLGVWDAGGVRTSHQEFGGRASQIDSPGGTHYHSTHVAGTLIAGGVVGSAKGMSPSGDLDCWDWNSDESEMRSAAASGLRVSSHSYSYATGWTWNSSYGEWFWYGDVTVSAVEDNWFGLYTSYTEDLDDTARDYPYYLICRSAGNDRNDDGPGGGGGHYYYNPGAGQWEWSTTTRNPDGNYDCLGTVCVAKNILVVGAVEDVSGGYSGPGSVPMSSFSSWGPTDDGRIKPDISGNGVGLYSTMNDSDTAYDSLSGTSMSTPNVAGSLGVLIQHWRDTHAGDMRSATLKGIVIHTADEAGGDDGPDYEFGWGLMNTLEAASVITADVTEPIVISEDTLSNGQTSEVNVTATGGSELRATICWTDPPGNPPGNLLNPTTKMLVNDLDLRIIRTSPSATYDPWVLDPSSPGNAATTGDNDVDNVEQVVVYSPGTSQYTVRVTHKGGLSGGSQAFSLIITGASSGCQDDPDCDDGLYCNGAETCVGGECQPGTDVDCDDSVGCTDDSCNEGTDSCDNIANDGFCDDGAYCNGSETCHVTLDCQAGTDVDCDDSVSCTDDSCNEGTDSCDNVANDGLCDNGFFCDGAETCHVTLDCQAGTDPCPGMVCDEAGDQCVECDDDGDCDDGQFCNGGETCVDGSCQPGTDVDCDDSVGCTDDSCNEGTDSCDNIPNDGLCDDGAYCNGSETCHATLDCQAGTDVDCDDSVSCTDDSCNEGTDSCDNIANDGLCDNGAFCDGAETCHVTLGCQAGTDPCPGMVCDEAGDQCVECDDNGDCDDSLFCNGEETCVGGSCQPGADPCPGQYCRESDDTCVECLVDGDCSDGAFCNGAETCDGNGDCQPGSDPCPDQICDEADDRCIECDDDGDCDDGNPCNGAETCDGDGNCQPGSCDSEVVVFEQHFDSGSGAFTYQDDTFRGTSNPGYADGTYESSGGLAGGGVRVVLGPVSTNMSGGWVSSFAITGSPTSIEIEVAFRLLFNGGYESDEYGQALLSIDGTLVGVAPNEYLHQFVGDGSTDWDSGWLTETFSMVLSSGTHEIILGGFNNKSTYSSEITETFFDDVKITAFYDNECECEDGVFCNGAETCVGDTCMPGSDPCPGQLCDEDTDTCVECLGDGDCDDGAWCNGSETCDVSGQCQPGTDPCPGQMCREGDDTCVDCLGDVDCDDTDYCNGAETCDANGVCQPGTDVDCDDSVGCTDDSCNEDTDSCDNIPNNGLCDDGAYCNGAETCDVLLGCQDGVDVDCDDDVMCTDDSCNEGTDSCDNIANDGLCDDGAYCNGAETCHVTLDCQAGTDVDCDDDVMCTDDSCNEGADSCDNIANDGLCDDGAYCNGAETCHVTLDCQAGTDVDCNDDVMCTDDSCNEGTDSCDNIPNDGLCNDGAYCNGAETCDVLLGCQDGVDVDCDDDVMCTDDSCNEGTDSCDNIANDGLCDDGAYCNGAETCDVLLGCQDGVDVDCDDDVMCTDDSCNEGTDSCDNIANNGLCNDGAYCNGAETCDVLLGCQDGVDVDCDDDVMCTDDSCNEGTDSCDNIANDGLCDDGAYCNGAETCDVLLGCQDGVDVDCDDDVMCTDDSCNEGTDSCDNIANDGLCDDGAYCNGAETCDVLLGCQDGVDVDCDDDVMCTDDSCNEGTDSCDNIANDGLCDDGAYCNGTETCHVTLDCQDGTDPCAADEWCDESGDQCIAYGNGDFDIDFDVDLADFAAFQGCFGQLGIGYCAPGDMAGTDGVIDLDDLAAFVTELEASGPN